MTDFKVRLHIERVLTSFYKDTLHISEGNFDSLMVEDEIFQFYSNVKLDKYDKYFLKMSYGLDVKICRRNHEKRYVIKGNLTNSLILHLERTL